MGQLQQRNQKSNGDIAPNSQSALSGQVGQGRTGMQQVSQARSIAEVQAEMVAAKQFPRDPNQAKATILENCKRHSLADESLYSYPRGGQTVSGPTVNLMKMIAQQWGNLEFGWKEIERHDDHSEVVAYCWDKETNTRERRDFIVGHYRDKKSGKERLTSEDDIYEKVSNFAARRMRSCIEGIVPADVIEDAKKQVKATLAQGPDGQSRQERIETMVAAFNEIGIDTDDLHSLLGRSVEKASNDDLVKLRTVYKTIRNNPDARDDFFSDSETVAEQELNQKFSGGGQKPEQSAPPQQGKGGQASGKKDDTPDLESVRRSIGSTLGGNGVPDRIKEAYTGKLREVGAYDDASLLAAHRDRLREADDKTAYAADYADVPVEQTPDEPADAPDWTLNGLRQASNQHSKLIQRVLGETDGEDEARAAIEYIADEHFGGEASELADVPPDQVTAVMKDAFSDGGLADIVDLATDEVPF